MTIHILGIDLYEFDIGLSDLILSLIISYFLFKLYRSGIQKSVLCIFIGLVLSSFIGALFHFFFPLKIGTGLGLVVWSGVALSISMVIHGILVYLLSGKMFDKISYISQIPWIYSITFLLYFFFVNQSYPTIIGFYFPVVLLFGLYGIYNLYTKKDNIYEFLVIGVCLSIIAGIVQVLKINLHPEYLTYNTFYHILQGIGIYFIYRYYLLSVSDF